MNQIKRNKIKVFRPLIVLGILALWGCVNESPDASLNPALFEYTDLMEPRWVSFENITGEKGRGGMENHGAKGHSCDHIPAGASITLLDIDGPGIIQRMWITLNRRDPEMLRSLVINIYWDGEEKPAVSAPFGDFFGVTHGETASFENLLFANPEGRSFNCFIPMPFKKHAKIVLTNQTEREMEMIFFDINLQMLRQWDDSYLFFHAHWHRDTATTLGKDFEILPAVSGKGRFLGSNIGVFYNGEYNHTWWGEGEVKMYLDGDDPYPTLVGSGTEDYIGSAWGQGKFVMQQSGCLVMDHEKTSFYRYHIKDPVYFKQDCRVTIQQIGGSDLDAVRSLQEQGAQLIPTLVHVPPEITHLYGGDGTSEPGLDSFEKGSVHFYRSDDLAAMAYFYLDSPVNDLPPLQSADIRLWKIHRR
ncbi:MAG: glycoside hydrolase family 172 protein [Bacteroidota bacterium]